jgi:predicted nucleotidyltransferase
VRHDAVPRDDVLAAFRRWARDLRDNHPDVVRVGCFGSYARNDHGPASDLDVFVELSDSPRERWFDRAQDLASTDVIPVGVELFVYTSSEVERMRGESSRWLEEILAEMIWA